MNDSVKEMVTKMESDYADSIKEWDNDFGYRSREVVVETITPNLKRFYIASTGNANALNEGNRPSVSPSSWEELIER